MALKPAQEKAAKKHLEDFLAKFPKSKALAEEGRKVIVRGATHDVRYADPFPLYAQRAQGSRKWDVDGNEYIDYFGGHGAHVLGHKHPDIVKAAMQVLTEGPGTQPSRFESPMAIEWGKQIMKMVPSCQRVEFVNSGTEANMMAARLARAYTGRPKLVKFREHFGGWYDAMMVGDIPPYEAASTGGTLPAIWAFTTVIPVNNPDALEWALKSRDVAAVFVEASGAHTGVIGIDRAFYPIMRNLCNKYGTLLSFDEVITGFRAAPGGWQQVMGITPDLTTFGKVVTGGFPGAGVVGGRADVMEMLNFKADPDWNRWRRVRHDGTFNANPLCSATGLAALKLLEDGKINKRIDQITRRIVSGVDAMLKERKITGCAYGTNGCFHLCFNECPTRDTCDREICLYERDDWWDRVITTPLYRNLVMNGVDVSAGIFGLPSGVHTDKDVDQTLEAYERTIDMTMEEGVFEPHEAVGKGGMKLGEKK